MGPSKEDFGSNFAVGGLNLQFFGVLYKSFGIPNVQGCSTLVKGKKETRKIENPGVLFKNIHQK